MPQSTEMRFFLFTSHLSSQNRELISGSLFQKASPQPEGQDSAQRRFLVDSPFHLKQLDKRRGTNLSPPLQKLDFVQSMCFVPLGNRALQHSVSKRFSDGVHPGGFGPGGWVKRQ